MIAGAGTAALELVDEVPGLDVGRRAGRRRRTALGHRARRARHRPEPRASSAPSPLAADDAARSLAAGRIVAPAPARDDRRRPAHRLSPRTFAVLAEHVETIVTVSEAEIVEAMHFVWSRTKQLIEPSAAVAVAAVRTRRSRRRARVGIILSGGNVDLDAAVRADSS